MNYEAIVKQKKLLMVIGGATVLAGAAMYYFKTKKTHRCLRNSLKAKTKYTKEDAINVYTRTKRNQFPILEYLIEESKKLEYKLKKHNKKYTEEQKMDYVLLKNKLFIKKLGILTGRVYSYFGLDKKTCKQFILFANELEKTDKRIIELHKASEAALISASQGNPINMDIKLPKSITPELTLKVYCQLTFLNLMSDYKIYHLLLEDTANLNPEFFKNISSKKNQYKKILSDVTKKYNFDISEHYHEHHVFQAALFQFKEKNQKFYIAAEKVKLLYRIVQNDFSSGMKSSQEIKNHIIQVFDIKM